MVKIIPFVNVVHDVVTSDLGCEGEASFALY